MRSGSWAFSCRNATVCSGQKLAEACKCRASESCLSCQGTAAPAQDLLRRYGISRPAILKTLEGQGDVRETV